MRLLESAVLITMTHTSDHAIPTNIREAGTRYHNLTIDQSGHKHGPPGSWITTEAAVAAYNITTNETDKLHFRAFVEQFSTPTLITEQDEAVQTQLTRYPDRTATEITATLNELSATNTEDTNSDGDSGVPRSPLPRRQSLHELSSSVEIDAPSSHGMPRQHDQLAHATSRMRTSIRHGERSLKQLLNQIGEESDGD